MTPMWLATALLALPLYRDDRAPDLAAVKAAQTQEIATAVAKAAAKQKWAGTPHELAALLITVGYSESKFALHIGRGDCRRYECDRDSKGNVRSVSFWQFKVRAASSPEAWELAKTDVNVAAREAARVLARSRYQCRSLEREGGDWLRLTLQAYATGGCRGYVKDLELRVATYLRILGRIGT
jgi:hypothetical protein